MSEENYAKKAVEVLIESLKLYFTFSTVLIAGSLTYFSKLSNPVSIWALYFEMAAFLMCAILSILNINFFIKDIKENERYDSANKNSKIPNIAAIVLFIAGLVFGIYFFCTNNNVPLPPNLPPLKVPTNEQIIVEKGKIIVPNQSKAKVKIILDSVKKTQCVYINYSQ